MAQLLDRSRRLWGLGALILATVISYQARLGTATAGFLYLLCVVLQATQGEFWPAAGVSALAVGALAFFFIPPDLSFAIGGVLDATSLAAFLVTGLVVTRLTSSLRIEADKVRRRIEQVQRIHEFGNRLLSLQPDQPDAAILEHACETFKLKGACLFDANQGEMYRAAEADAYLVARTREAYTEDVERDEPQQSLAVRILRIAGRPIGSIGLRGLEDPALIGSIANLTATALERARVTLQLSHSRAEAEAELLRRAILDGLVHDFKTPLATIMTLAGSLMEPAAGGDGVAETAKLIEDEAERLNRLSTRLLRIGRLDREAIHLHREAIDFTELVRSVVKQYAMVGSGNVLFETESPECEILADAELLSLVAGLLLDNGLKYGDAPGGVRVTLSVEERAAVLAVSNPGRTIQPEERERIFDRYFRGSRAQMAPGSGLGLHVARRIVEAHGGSLVVDPESDRTTFVLTLPLWKEDESNV